VNIKSLQRALPLSLLLVFPLMAPADADPGPVIALRAFFPIGSLQIAQ